MDTKGMIAGTIDDDVIKRTTRWLASRYGWEVAEEAVASALLRVCESYNPAHHSGASPITYFKKSAIGIAIDLCNERGKECNVVSLDEPADEDGDATNHEVIGRMQDFDVEIERGDPTWLYTLPIVEATVRELNRMLFTAETGVKVSQIRLAKKVIKEIEALVEQSVEQDLDCDFGYGNRQSIYETVAERLGVSWRSVHNAMVYVRQALVAARPEACRLWAQGIAC
jgi:DNA-directed RNA polymerase specialized sigma24 family protein